MEIRLTNTFLVTVTLLGACGVVLSTTKVVSTLSVATSLLTLTKCTISYNIDNKGQSERIGKDGLF